MMTHHEVIDEIHKAAKDAAIDAACGRTHVTRNPYKEDTTLYNLWAYAFRSAYAVEAGYELPWPASEKGTTQCTES